ncbi:MAG TPA: DNA-formamidopyrimidine glycosylase family protein [Pseudonocardiaceae bacterium]|nr:DNA-formamidopyrimidine glycosylase family protein [Pseudonocardiaceae bacterium]
MPELPEVESARSVIERAALNRRIVDVDDSDSYVCRPHSPGQIRAALIGRTLRAAHRRGKSLWCDTSPSADSDAAGPVLGVHLGMSGKIVIADSDGVEVDGGDYWERGRQPGDHRWSRFALTFDDGGRMLLIDPRRLGRIQLDPAVELLGPDAATVRPAEFRAAISRGSAPIKARLLDQRAIAGIGNLLADEILWRARINPAHPVDELSAQEVDRLQRATRRAVSDALRDGGVHELSIIPFRKAGAQCPRDHSPMVRGKVGGRTTWWCSTEQTA